MNNSIHVSIQNEDFDIAQEQQALLRNNTNIGAVVAFTGLCRDESGRLSALELEHYPVMASEQIKRMAAAAKERFSLDAVRIIHRYGLIKPGENIVLVLTASGHREAAFQGADFLMDYMKTDAPFWKKEHLIEGQSGDWVAARDRDDAAKKRWEQQ
jgi:molybdopterin synthase catalytic subunit